MMTFRATICISLFACLVMSSPSMAQQKQAAPAASAQQAPVSQTQTPVQPAAVAMPAATDNAASGLPAKMSPVPVAAHDLSPWSMFLSADIIVKAVMIFLALASLTTWTIFFAKMREQHVARRGLSADLDAIAESRSLGEARLALGSKQTILKAFIGAAGKEIRLSNGLGNDAGIKERAASRFAEITRGESNRMRVGMGILATVGSTAPFIGLFGTVWGIMNSFIGISKSQTTNLAVVAPGIAEALLATACGLVAAIPAVIIYNHFTRDTKRYIELVNQAAGATGRLLSRDLDRSHGGAVSYAAE